MRRLVALLAPVCALAAACGQGDEPAAAELSAVASVYPLAWVAEQVAPRVEVSVLNAGGLEAHDLEVTPNQRQAIETSDVVLFVGDIAYQPQVEEAVADARGKVVSLAEVAGPERLLEPSEEAHAGEEEGEHAGEEEATVDPHMWFDPSVMADAAVRTGEAFAAADPDNADTYRANAEELQGQFVALEEELAAMLGGECQHNEAIVSHQAYGYLLEPFGISQHGVTGINPEAGASSGELAELVEEIRAEGFDFVLTEPVEGREGAETVAREAGVELLEISPLDAVTEDQADDDFIGLLREQAEQFAVALGC